MVGWLLGEALLKVGTRHGDPRMMRDGKALLSEVPANDP
jgi:hypothetical protein